jgi:uroporphyrinogen decarboxylase
VLGRELEALRLILNGRSDDVPVFHTVFTPLTIARKLAGERLAQDLRDHPGAVMAALDVITETVSRYAAAVAKTGAEGIFYASQDANPDVMSQADHAKFAMPYSRRALDSIKGSPVWVMLHVHGQRIYFDQKTALPVAAINWHDRLTEPSLGEALKRFSGAAVGGLGEKDVLLKGPPSAVTAQAQDAVRQSGGTGVIVAPGCVLPLATPDENLEAAIKGVKG